MDEAKKLVVLEQENEELKRELKELFKTLCVSDGHVL